MHCPYCRHSDSRVLDSRVAEDGSSIRRRRECRECQRRFTTLEQMQLVVVKRSGVVEPFSRDKVVTGVRKACKGRPVTEAQLAKLGQQVEESIRASGLAEVQADQVGIAILSPLRALDPVAYLRFASVYQNYESVDDFLSEIARLRDAAEGGSTPASAGPASETAEAATPAGGPVPARDDADGETDASSAEAPGPDREGAAEPDPDPATRRRRRAKKAPQSPLTPTEQLF